MCSRDRTRTYNLPVNSRTLCRLSYAGPSPISVAHRKGCPPHGTLRLNGRRDAERRDARDE